MVGLIFNNFSDDVSQKIHRLFKVLIPAFFIAFLTAILSVSSVSADGTVNWTGQGTTNGTLNTVQCSGDTAQAGSLLWVFTASGATSATITINGQTFAMTQEGQGNGTFKYVQTNFNGDFSSLNVSATYVGTVNGNPQLTISHGCPALTAKVTLTKTFAQGPFTTIPALGDACFTLAPSAGMSSSQQCTNTPLWEGLPTGDYTVSETSTPAGYTTMASITFRVRNDCTGVASPCVTTGNTTAFELGPVVNQLLPGLLQVRKLLGPQNTLWTNPTVSFFVCAHNPAGTATELTPAQCNAATPGVVTLTVPPNPSTSGNLAEGYYTVCENVPVGYTVDDRCQVVSVEAGSTAASNQVTFVNTPPGAGTGQLFWCSPGFWASAIKQNRTGVFNYLEAHSNLSLASLNTTLYSTIGGAPLSKKASNQNPTLAQVLASPNTYGGPAFNSVANYIAQQLGWGGTQTTGENCPLNAQGEFTAPTLSLLFV
jgi:hypothetical protein